MFVYRDVSPEELHVPLTQVIYVGDGASDIPCFSLLNEEKGVAIGVYKGRTAEDWGRELEMSRGQRVANVAPAEYSEDSELMRSLKLAVESMCFQIALHPTLAEMFPNRLWVSLASGEALNERITGEHWPPKSERNARLKECVDIIRALWAGETVTHYGRVRVEEAKLYTRPEIPLLTGVGFLQESE
jgi:hypothetical protein